MMTGLPLATACVVVMHHHHTGSRQWEASPSTGSHEVW